MENCQSILESIYNHALETPDKLCVGDKVRAFTYSQFWELIKGAASHLRARGVKKGTVVAIRGCQRAEYFLGHFGVQLAGGIPCPLERGIGKNRIAQIMEGVGSSILLNDKQTDLPGVTNILYEELRHVPAGSESFLLPQGEDISELLFTTGTTGRSKGIELLHSGNVAIAQNISAALGSGPEVTELITAPLTHSMALRRSYSQLYIGGSIVLTDGAKFINSFFELMDRFGVTAISFVPAILEQVLIAGGERLSQYDGLLRYIEFGSAALSEERKQTLRKLLPHVRLFDIYGSTEAGCATFFEFSRYTKKPGCIGHPTVNTELFFVDENRRPVRATRDEPGFLAISGGMNMRGYYKDPALTAEVMDRDGRIYTNDLGYMGEDGSVYLLGRRGDVISVGGIKVSPAEVEEVAAKFPAVLDCACVPIPDDITGETVKLFVVPHPDLDLDRSELTKYLSERLETMKVPKAYEIIPEIPRTFNGKIIRNKLKERNQYEEGHYRHTP